MFDFMEEKGFYTNKDSGEGPFVIIFNDSYMKECNRITLVLPKDIDTSKFAREVFDWLKSITRHVPELPANLHRGNPLSL